MMYELIGLIVLAIIIVGVGRLFISTGDEYHIPSTKKNTKG